MTTDLRTAAKDVLDHAHASSDAADYVTVHRSLLGALRNALGSSVETSGNLVAGDTLPTTLAQFQLRANRLLQDEQEKPNPDNALVGFLCDAVRLARENERMAKRGIEPRADMYTPWPLHDVLAKLIDATEHLRYAHDCDWHGHEEYWTAMARGKEYLRTLRSPENAPDHLPDPTKGMDACGQGVGETSCIGCTQGWHRQADYPDTTKNVHCPPRFIECTAVNGGATRKTGCAHTDILDNKCLQCGEVRTGAGWLADTRRG